MDDTTARTAKPAIAPPQTVKDSLGRTLTIRKLDALAELDLIEAAGGNAENRRWMMMATIAACVVDIDGTPMPPLSKRQDIRTVVQRVGSEGIDAVMTALSPAERDVAESDQAEVAAAAKNLADNQPSAR